MTNPKMMNSGKPRIKDVAKSVVELKEKHRQTWRDKSQLYWMFGLLEEVVELIGALLGLHKDPVEWELMQISAICMNWIELRNPQILPIQRPPDKGLAKQVGDSNMQSQDDD